MKLTVLGREGTLLEHLGGAKLVAAVHDGEVAHDAAEVHALVDGRVAAADDNGVLAGEEVAVAGGAVGDASTGELFLARDAELVVLAAGGDDDGLRRVLALLADDDLDLVVELQVDHGVDGKEGAGVLRLLVHEHPDVGAQDAVREAGVVLNVGGVQDLPAGGELFHDERFQLRPRGVDSGAEASGSSAYDDDIVLCLHAPTFTVRCANFIVAKRPTEG